MASLQTLLFLPSSAPNLFASCQLSEVGLLSSPQQKIQNPTLWCKLGGTGTAECGFESQMQSSHLEVLRKSASFPQGMQMFLASWKTGKCLIWSEWSEAGEPRWGWKIPPATWGDLAKARAVFQGLCPRGEDSSRDPGSNLGK